MAKAIEKEMKLKLDATEARGQEVYDLLVLSRNGCDREATLDVLAAAMRTAVEIASALKRDGRPHKGTLAASEVMARLFLMFEAASSCGVDHGAAGDN